MALHRWARFLRVSFSMFLIFFLIFGISTIDFIQKASLNVQFRGPLNKFKIFSFQSSRKNVLTESDRISASLLIQNSHMGSLQLLA